MAFVEIKQEHPVFSPLLRRYTLEEFWALPDPEDRFHYDLIGGHLFMVPPPDSPHGRLDSRLNRLLVEFLFKHELQGEVLHPREAIYTSATYLEPDMMYVSEELRLQMGRKRYSADIVFEYASKSTAVYDRTTKADTYLALGVRELWIVDSSTKTIEVRHPGTYEDKPIWEVRLYSQVDWAESKVLQGWRVSVEELFEGLSEE